MGTYVNFALAFDITSTNPQTGSTMLIGFQNQTEKCCNSMAINHASNLLVYSTAIFDNESGIQISKLWVYDFQNKIPKQLDIAGNFSNISDLRFSPDDKKLLFISDSCGQGHRQLYVLSLSDLKIQCSELTNVYGADWFSDGSIVYLKKSSDGDTIIAHNMDGTEKTLYSRNHLENDNGTQVYSDIVSLKVSPDGKKIAFWVEKMLNSEDIFILDLTSGQIKHMQETGTKPTWGSSNNLFYIDNLVPRPPNPEFEKNNPLSIVKMADMQEISTLLVSPAGMWISDMAVSYDHKLIYSLQSSISSDKSMQPGIYYVEINEQAPIFTNPSATPEFPVAIPVLIASIASLIIFYRMKLLKR